MEPSIPTPSKALIARLHTVDTPTVLNAIELARGKRGFDQFTRSSILAADPNLPAMCGFARTARVRGNSPATELPEQISKQRMDYYRYVAGGPRPGVTVIEDIDYPDTTGAFWGEVNVAVHKGFGLAGAFTNGVMRDLGDLDPGFQVLAGSIGPSHGYVRVIECSIPVTLFGLTISPGDFIHADRHGAIIVPPELFPVLEAAIDKLNQIEKLMLDPAREPGFDFEKFAAAWEAFEQARV